MSNVAGKAYAMNVVTPIRGYLTLVNKFIFWLAGTRLFQAKLRGLRTLSLIHYARWVVLRPDDFPVLSEEQPAETLRYSYMFFFSDFNGSWAQYVDSFSAAIPSGLDLLWYRNLKYPGSIPLQPFHSYITANQLWTSHYYSAYPLASSNDVKAGARVRRKLCEFIDEVRGVNPAEFKVCYERLLLELQSDLAPMEAAPPLGAAALPVPAGAPRAALATGA